MRSIFFSLLLLFNCAATANAPFDKTYRQGIVVKIIDGDTFDVLTKEKKTIRVRMNGIDSPERKQDFYQVAKDALAGYIFKKEVRLTVSGYDRNRRAIAIVWCKDENINLAMIKNGYAWHYKKYSTDTSFAKAEKGARMEKKGLWQGSPVAPWEFRRRQKSYFFI